MVHEKEVALAHWMNVCRGAAAGGGGSEGRGPAVAREPGQGGPETVAVAPGRRRACLRERHHRERRRLQPR